MSARPSDIASVLPVGAAKVTSGVRTAHAVTPVNASDYYDGVNIFGHHDVIILPYTYGDGTPQSDADVAEITRQFNEDVNDYWGAASGGKISVSVSKVLPWVTLPKPSDGCDVDPIFANGQAAAHFSNDNLFEHLVIYTPDQSCSNTGMASGVPGSMMILRGSLDPKGAIHEFGHNLGLMHANSLSSRDDPNGPWLPYGDEVRANVARWEYGDPYDVMGVGTHGPSGFELRVLGILDNTTAPVLTRSQTVHLAPLHGTAALLPGQVRSVSVPAGDEQYFFDYRADVPGLDAGINGPRWPYDTQPIGSGITVTMEGNSDDYHVGATLLSRTVMSDDGYGATPSAFTPGMTWTSPDHQVRMTVLSADDTGADVQIDRMPDVTAPSGLQILVPQQNPDGSLTIMWLPPVDAATGVAGYDVSVDGKVVAHADRKAQEVALSPAPADGMRHFQVTVKDRAGNAVSSDVDWLLDAAPPAVSLSGPVPTTGSAGSDGSIPTVLRWSASDAGIGLCRQLLSQTGHSSAELGTGPRARTVSSRPGASTLTLRVEDCAAHVTQRSTTMTTTSQNTLRTAKLQGFARATWPASIGRDAVTSSKAGARVSWTCTGRYCGVIATQGSTQGKAAILVNGKQVATIDLRATSTRSHQVVWMCDARTAATRTVTVVNLGTRGRPAVNVDEFVSVR